MTAWRSVLVEHFARVKRDRSSDVAICALSEDRVLRFEEVWEDFLAFYRVLGTAGLRPGSAIVSLVGNSAAFVSTLLAVLEHGGIVIPVDTGSTAAEAIRLIDQFSADAAIAPAATRFSRPAGITPLPHNLALFRFRSSWSSGVHEGAVFKLTSGSVGAPKAVSSSEINLVADGNHIIEAMGIGPQDINLAMIPLSHSYGIGNLVVPLLLQGSTFVSRQSFAPHQLFDDVTRHRITVFPAVPFIFDYLRRHFSDRRFPSSLRLTVTAGASIQYETVAEFRRIFGLKIHSFYGTSETGGIAYDDSESIEHPLRVGRALPGTTITLRPWDASCGRVHVRGDAVAASYAPGSAEDDATFCEQGFLTGDLGYFVGDELVLAGRLPRFVNVAGRKVQPDEVERVLLEIPEIANVCVLGLPCDKRGEMLVAVIVPEQRQYVSPAAIRTYCSGRLSSHKIPRQYAFVDTLPVDSRGKTDLRAIESLFAQQLGVEPAES